MPHIPLHDTELAEEPGTSTLSLRQFFTILRAYKAAILLSLVAVVAGYALVVVAYVVLSPSRRITTLPFRLEFKGAESGVYPNGTPFSASEIVNTPILLSVYNANALSDMVAYQTFKNAIFIVESNPALEALEREYRAKLAEPKLSAIDRDRLEQEFQQKRASISRSDYAINYVDSGQVKRLPKTVHVKILNDILATWAEQTTQHKGVVLYDLGTISSSTFDKSSIDRYDYLIALDMLRVKINRVIGNIDSLSQIPGAKVLRTAAPARASLDEMRFRLMDAIKFKIEPLTGTIINSGLTGGPIQATEFLQTRLSFNEIERKQAEGRVQMLREALAAYDSSSGPAAQSTSTSAPPPTVVPQVDNTFLERLVTLSNKSQDFQYRQNIVDNIQAESLKIVPLQGEEQYYRSLLGSLQRHGGPAARPEETARIREQIVGVFDEAIRTTDQVMEVYQAVSQNLNPSAVLYSTTAPPVTRQESSAASVSQLLLVAALLLLLTLPLSMIGSFLHYRFTTEGLAEAEGTQPETRVAVHGERAAGA